MTIDTEIRAIGTLLLPEAIEARRALFGAQMQTDVGRCIHYAMNVLDSKDIDVDVLNVFEFVRDSPSCKALFPKAQEQVTLRLLTDAVLSFMDRDEASAYLLALPASAADDDDHGSEWVDMGAE